MEVKKIGVGRECSLGTRARAGESDRETEGWREYWPRRGPVVEEGKNAGKDGVLMGYNVRGGGA